MGGPLSVTFSNIYLTKLKINKVTSLGPGQLHMTTTLGHRKNADQNTMTS